MFDPHRHHRRSVRLVPYDYGAASTYFVTVCAAHNRAAFGRIECCVMRLHPYGRIVEEEWMRSAAVRPAVALDVFVVMPNHFHAIVWITKTVTPDETPVGARLASPSISPDYVTLPDMDKARDVLGEAGLGEASLAPTGVVQAAKCSLGAIIGGFKSAVTRRINLDRAARSLPPVVVWQRSFHDRIIRDARELEIKRRYIIENPLHWEKDKYHP